MYFMVTNIDLIEIIKTKDDASALHTQIDNILSESFNNTKQINELIDEILSYHTKTKMLALVSREKIDMNDLQKLRLFFSEVKKNIETLPVVSLTLAVSPGQRFISMLSSWFFLNTKKAVLLDITVDPTLIGGALIGYKGYYKDFSLKKLLQEKYRKGELYFKNSV